MGKRRRVIGTTRATVAAAERELGKALPPSFVAWIIEHNGLGIRDANINVYQVFDARDHRTAVDSTVQHNPEEWRSDFAEEKEKLTHLLVFGDTDSSGDNYCFDYARIRQDGEAPVVRRVVRTTGHGLGGGARELAGEGRWC